MSWRTRCPRLVVRVRHRRTLTALLVLATSLGSSFLDANGLQAQIRINEVLAVNRNTVVDDDGESSDWIELLNTAETPVDLLGYGISDDLENPLKWVFPSKVLEPGEFVLVWCSGKDRTSPSVDAVIQRDSPIPFTPNVLGLDHLWRFLVGQPEDPGPPANWFEPNFDDTTWPTGIPGFGFGDDDDRTVLPEDIGAVFLRTTFDVEDPETLGPLVLQVNYDDGFVLYLNGERVLEANFPPEEEATFASNSTRSREARAPQRWIVDDWAERLVPGENRLAAVILNRTTTSGDMSFAPEIGTVPPVFHTNFRLDQDGELLFLFDPALNDFSDALVLPEQAMDRSYGRPPSAGNEFRYLLFATPGAANDDHASDRMISDTIDFSPAAGTHQNDVNVSLQADIPFKGFQIRYTTNGTEPTTRSDLYENPIPLDGRNTVIRAAGFLDGRTLLKAQSGTYFLRPDSLALPRVSISMDPSVFNGLHNNGGGRGRTSEREGYIEFFDANGEIQASTGFGIRLHGGAGRNGGLNIKKAYKAYFRGEYGDRRLRMPLLDRTEVSSFDKLVLRSNFNDAFRTGREASLIRDQVIRDIHEDMGATVSHGTWCNLFVNTQHRGVYNIVERMDRKFFDSYFPEDGENWDVVKTGNDILDGNAVEWNRMLQFFRRNQGGVWTDRIYEEALELIDVENYTGYMLLNIWAQNHDWPHNNWYAARPQREDGKWIFLSWDAEFGLGRIPAGYSSDTFTHVLGRSTSSLGLIIAGLIRSPRFGEYLLAETDRHLAGALAPENVLAHISRHTSIITPDMPDEARLTGGNFTQWQANIRAIQTFAERRGAVFRNTIFNSSRVLVPRISRVTPNSVDLPGDTPEDREIIINGFGFASDMEVLVNGVPAELLDDLTSRRVTIRLPLDERIAGEPELTTRHPTRGGYTTRNALQVGLMRPNVDVILPEEGSSSGGELVRIFGSEFSPVVRVEFGGVPALSAELFGESGRVIDAVTPPGSGVVAVRVINTIPFEITSSDEVEYHYVGGASPQFVRGDCDLDGRLSITDAVCVLRSLFAGAGDVACEKGADSDDSGTIDLTDGVHLLNGLFRRGPPPAPPFPDCGNDASEDLLTCATSGCA